MNIKDWAPTSGRSQRTGGRGPGSCRAAAIAFGIVATWLVWPALSGCEILLPACTPSVEPGVSVLLTDEQGAAIEGATLTLMSDGFTEVMQDSGQGRYIGAEERPGTYQLMIEADGFTPRSVENIQAGAGRCHVITANLELTLSAAANSS